ncbi:MAG: nitrate/nitrite transporter [Salinirussus sp.]
MDRPEHGAWRPWIGVAALWLLVAAVNCFYVAPSGILPVIMSELSVGPAAASALVSVMFGAQVIVGVPAGLAADRFDRRLGLAGATVFAVITFSASWLAAAAGSFWWLLAGRGVATAAIAAIFTGSVGVTGELVPPDQRGTAVGIITGAPMAGFALGLTTAPIVAEWMGWAAVFGVYTVPAVAACLVFLVVTRNLKIDTADLPTPALPDVGALLSIRSIWIIAVTIFLAYSIFAFVTTWVPTYLAEVHGMTLAAGGLLAATFPAVGAVARGSSGYVSDRLFRRRRRPVALLAFLVTAPSLAALFGADALPVMGLSLVLAGVFVQLGQGLFFVLARELAPPNVAATAVGFTTSVGTLGGFVAPLAGGVLVEHGGYSAAFGAAVVFAVIGVAVSWFTPEPAD